MRKAVFGVSEQVQHKPGCRTTDDGLIEAWNFGFNRKKRA